MFNVLFYCITLADMPVEWRVECPILHYMFYYAAFLAGLAHLSVHLSVQAPNSRTERRR